MPEACICDQNQNDSQEQEAQVCQPVGEYPPKAYPPDHPCCDQKLRNAGDVIKGPQVGDACPPMGPLGPWATGRVDWGPLAGLTGTRPVVDRYSITRYSNDEWRNHNAALVNETAAKHQSANRVDHESRRAAECTASRADKAQLDSTERLQRRAQDVHCWKTELERAAVAAGEEINLLDGQRQRLRTALGVLRLPAAIAGECLELRTARLEPDLVRDRVEEELVKEVALASEVGELMQCTLKRFEEQLAANKAAKQRAECDWSDKKEAYEIETTNVGLRNNSPDILFHPGATRFGGSQSSPESWERHTRESLELLEAENKRSKELRGTLDALLTNVSRDLRAQADLVDAALACRIAETTEALRFFESDLLQTLSHLAQTQKLILDLKTAVRAQDMPLKVAQTRLHNRLERPSVENCRDEPQYGLVDEVKCISAGVAGLLGQLKQAEDLLQTLLKNRADLERAILVKRKTLVIDGERCRELRSHFPSSVALSGY
ncbi:tektin-4 [Bacillus rossius redtenbacheri]|uniref:tektin-4 n=1 Tax=Bacillus rossius redtenbacheri TaxID=93214 RepID=UPI002FDE4825